MPVKHTGRPRLLDYPSMDDVNRPSFLERGTEAFPRVWVDRLTLDIFVWDLSLPARRSSYVWRFGAAVEPPEPGNAGYRWWPIRNPQDARAFYFDALCAERPPECFVRSTLPLPQVPTFPAEMAAAQRRRDRNQRLTAALLANLRAAKPAIDEIQRQYQAGTKKPAP